MGLSAKDEVRFLGHGICSMADEVADLMNKFKMFHRKDTAAWEKLAEAQSALITLGMDLENFGREDDENEG